VTGVDLYSQPNYPFTFIKSDVFLLSPSYLAEFDYIWASPPCQHYSTLKYLTGKQYPDLIESTRSLLQESNTYYTIENVVGAPLINPVLLCGTMFGLRTYRHRLFESNFTVQQPEHPAHQHKVAKMGRRPKDGEYLTICGHFSGVELAREIMGCSWMTQRQLSQAIPSSYSRYIARQLLSIIGEQYEPPP
jgi:DNA (cytosine-5)-methyltransferase 1